MIKKKARILITRDCNRDCPGCCNKYSTIMSSIKPLTNISLLADYDEVMVTGGEPMLYKPIIKRFVEEIRKVNKQCKLYLYTALHKHYSLYIYNMFDGIHYTLHSAANRIDIERFESFQKLMSEINNDSHISLRLYIDPMVERSLVLWPWVWNRVEVKPWLTEKELLARGNNGLPQGEELFELKGAI